MKSDQCDPILVAINLLRFHLTDTLQCNFVTLFYYFLVEDLVQGMTYSKKSPINCYVCVIINTVINVSNMGLINLHINQY